MSARAVIYVATLVLLSGCGPKKGDVQDLLSNCAGKASVEIRINSFWSEVAVRCDELKNSVKEPQ